MPTTLPPATDFTGPTTTEGGQKTFITALRAFIADILGTDSTPAAARDAIGAGALCFRNLIVNGDLSVSQENGNTLVSINSGTAKYPSDNLACFGTASAGVFSAQRVASGGPVGMPDYVRLATTTADAAPAAGSSYAAAFCVEGALIKRLGWGAAGALDITTNFRARSSLTGTFSGSLRNGATNRSYPFTFSIPGAGVWTPLVLNIAGDVAGTWPIDSTLGMILTLDVGSGATLRGPAGAWATGNYFGVTGAVRLISTLSATLDIAGVQLEPGAVLASTFEYLPPEINLQRCKRLFERLNYGGGEELGSASVRTSFNPPTVSGLILPFTPGKRTAGTIASSGASTFSVASAVCSGVSFGNSATAGWGNFDAGSGNTGSSWTSANVNANGAAAIDWNSRFF